VGKKKSKRKGVNFTPFLLALFTPFLPFCPFFKNLLEILAALESRKNNTIQIFNIKFN
jgi:hypothetical protein